MIRANEPDAERTGMILQNWMRRKDTIEYIGFWEMLSNPELVGKYNMRDTTTINQLVVLSNMDSSNSEMIKQGIDHSQHFETPHKMATEQLDWVNPKNKSYVAVDDMYYITNIIEKRIVSHYFTAGGYSFADAATYCQYYERMQDQRGLYLSHIIYSMLLEGHTFRSVLTQEYEDFEGVF